MIRVGLLGAGHLGKIHLKLLKNLPGVEITGFHDTDATVCSKVEPEYGVPSFADAKALIAASDAVDIVTPTPFHYEYASAAIRAGKHIFIEKPVTVNSQEAKKLLGLANEAKVVAHAGHVERFNPAFLAGRPHITRPVFIDCRRIATWNPRGTDVSVVLDLMVHDIDLVLHLVKSSIKKISATGSPVLCPTDDIAEARLEFDNGCVATISCSRVATNNIRKMTVFQQSDYISMDFLEKTASRSYPGVDAAGAKLLHHDKLETHPVNAIEHELKLFLAAIGKEKNEAVTLEDACNTMKVADEIMAVIRKNS
jgi:hypothetical protein